MARIRTIKPEFFRHHELYLAEIEEKLPLRVAFAGLWTAADREGRFRWVPEALKLDCLPYDKVDFSRVLDALLTRGFIRQYGSNGALYGHIPSFLNHQVINNREKPSCLPSPDNADTSTRATRDANACPTPLSLAQGEGKGREGNMEGNMEARVADAWNATAGVTQIRKLDLTRRKTLKTRLSDSSWDWQLALSKFPLRCFEAGTFRPNFDWFLKPATVNAIIEGKYDFTPLGRANNGGGKTDGFREYAESQGLLAGLASESGGGK